MNPKWRLLMAIGFLSSALWVAGCGGGSSGPTPQPTATPTVSATRTPIANNSIVVHLSDSSGLAVDGVVTLTSGINVYRLGTTGGQATFVGFAPGTYSISAQAGDQSQTRSLTVGSGTTTANFVFQSSVTPAPTGTIPPTPF